MLSNGATSSGIVNQYDRFNQVRNVNYTPFLYTIIDTIYYKQEGNLMFSKKNSAKSRHARCSIFRCAGLPVSAPAFRRKIPWIQLFRSQL